MSKQVLQIACAKIGFEVVFLQYFVSVFRSHATAGIPRKIPIKTF